VADGDGDSSVFFDDFFFGDSEGEADSSAVAEAFFFVLVELLFLVVAAWVVVLAPVEVAVSSFFVMQEVTSATVAKVVIRNRTGFFIG
jgi:hypothetical protein